MEYIVTWSFFDINIKCINNVIFVHKIEWNMQRMNIWKHKKHRSIQVWKREPHTYTTIYIYTTARERAEKEFQNCISLHDGDCLNFLFQNLCNLEFSICTQFQLKNKIVNFNFLYTFFSSFSRSSFISKLLLFFFLVLLKHSFVLKI